MPRTTAQRPTDHRAVTTSPLRRRRPFLAGAVAGAVGVLLLAVVVGGAWWSVSRPDPVQRRADELRAESLDRDAAQVEELTALARRTRDMIVPVVETLEETSEDPVSDHDVAALAAAVDEAQTALADPPSGSTEINVARSALAVAVDQLEVAVSTYEASLELPVAEGDVAAAATARQLDLVIRTWSIGATQLDWVNVSAGRGHQHVFLPTQARGALTADPAAEGSGAHHDAD